MEIKTPRSASRADLIVCLVTGNEKAHIHAGNDEWKKLKSLLGADRKVIYLGSTDDSRVFVHVPGKDATPKDVEALRMTGAEVFGHGVKSKSAHVLVDAGETSSHLASSFCEGFSMASYQFNRYKKEKKSLRHPVEALFVSGKHIGEKELNELAVLSRAVSFARDLINEPLSYLTATQLSKEIEKAGKKSGFTTQVLHKKQIETLRMGGLLGVNKGSIDPPTFTILEYKPRVRNNKKPIVLVGKGVVFDTGGLSLKSTPGSMDEMKCDMSGAAAVAGAVQAIADAGLPVHVIGLIPATDNRPGMNAIVPQDVLTMMDGTTVEVMNTDAEGRLILADALVYAKRFKPELVIDLATLTGAAVRAVGTYASAVMGTAPREVMQGLNDASMEVWERMVEFPLWQDYADELKSEVADMKNLGQGNAGQISAAKFLEHFTDYPWIHIDIAGPAWSASAQGYRTKGGTGVGVRWLYQFIKKNYAKAG